jgi:TRAP-type C4-dicarboxylate transport system permease small subunit
MQFLETIDRAIGALCRGVLYLTLSVVFAILTANVFLRYVSGTSLASASELPELLFPWMIMAGVVLAAPHGSHIAVVILTQKLGDAQRWVLAGGSLVVIALYASLAAMAWPLAEVAADEKSPMLQVPGSYSVYCLMLGFGLLAVTTLCHLPKVWAGAHESTEEHAEAVAHGA